MIVKVGNIVLGTVTQETIGRWSAVVGVAQLGIFPDKRAAIDAVWDHWNGFSIRNQIEETVGS